MRDEPSWLTLELLSLNAEKLKLSVLTNSITAPRITSIRLDLSSS